MKNRVVKKYVVKKAVVKKCMPVKIGKKPLRVCIFKKVNGERV